MRTATIKWEKESTPIYKKSVIVSYIETYFGVVNGNTLFQIEQKGVRKPYWVLKTYPIKSNIFTKANNTKIIYKEVDLDNVKDFGQARLNEFVSTLQEPGMSYQTENFISERISQSSSDISKTCYIIVREHLNKL